MNTALYDAIKSRRVTRSMSDQPIDQESLTLVLDSARWAPNAGNRRLQETFLATDIALVKKIKAVSPGMLPIPAAIVAICVNHRRAREFGFQSDYRGLYIDVGTTAATMLLAAHATGLGACPVSSFSAAAVSPGCSPCPMNARPRCSFAWEGPRRFNPT